MNATHRRTNTPEYRSWTAMKSRCLNARSPAYKYYGGRGIVICGQWMKFTAFLEDMGPRPSPKHSLDRYPNTNGNYEPGNCRWATIHEQNQNRRNNVTYEFNGERVTQNDLSRRLGISQAALWSRTARGVSCDRLFHAGKMSAQGDRNHGAQLTEAQAREILRRANQGLPRGDKRKLAAEFSVSTQVIQRLIARRTWKHL